MNYVRTDPVLDPLGRKRRSSMCFRTGRSMDWMSSAVGIRMNLDAPREDKTHCGFAASVLETTRKRLIHRELAATLTLAQGYATDVAWRYAPSSCGYASWNPCSRNSIAAKAGTCRSDNDA